MAVCDIAKRNCNILSGDEEIGHVFGEKPLIAYKRDRSLRDLLACSTLKCANSTSGTSKCNKSRCLTCVHINDSKMIVGPKGTFTVRSSFTCASEGLIYAIECNKCGETYIGETGRKLKDRFREHRRFVTINKADNEVAAHFNRTDHDGVHDMRVCGLLYCSDVQERKLKEQKIISKLGTVLGRGMNTDFNFPHLL